MKWLLKKFKYVQTLEEDLYLLSKERNDFINALKEREEEEFLNQTGCLPPEEFEWDPEGHQKYAAIPAADS